MNRIGVDIGGTFTDFALIDPDGRRTAIHKQLTTPQDPSVAVLAGIGALLKREGIALAKVAEVVHGTTLVTNAVIERRGAVTGMLVTEGFRDALDMGREQRYDLFDLRLRFPAPLVPRHLRREVRERMRYDGAVEAALDEDAVRRAAADLLTGHRVEAIAICFLHAYANPAHEERAREILAREIPGLFVSTSSDVFPYVREYERWTTTTVNAYTQPMFDRYLKRLEDGLAALGFKGRLSIVTSSGGLVTTSTARRYPVRMLESGPAAGVLMSCHVGRKLGLDRVLSFDMGGTTAKGALVRAGAALKRYEFEAARVHEHKHGSGLPLRIPVIDMTEIGAGGGSIAEVDERGLIRVGPRSAGADPGPACYGRNGTAATLTDANLVLGYLDPGFFLGGAMRLDRAAAERAIGRAVADPLKLDTVRAAWGIHEIVNEDVARAFRIHATERGFDYRRCAMIAFGGCGPIHATAIARKLKVPRVVFPMGAGVMSAIGMLVSPVSFEVARTLKAGIAEIDAARFAAIIDGLSADAQAFLLQAGIARADIRTDRRVDMRYRGQGYEIEVALPQDLGPQAAFALLPQLFAERYKEVFHVTLAEQVEIVTWKVEARGPTPKDDGLVAGPAVAGAKERKGTRRAYFAEAGGLVDCPVYDRYALRPGYAVEGPALVEERESTCRLGPGERALVNDALDLVVEVPAAGGAGSAEPRAKARKSKVAA